MTLAKQIEQLIQARLKEMVGQPMTDCEAELDELVSVLLEQAFAIMYMAAKGNHSITHASVIAAIEYLKQGLDMIRLKHTH